VQSRDRAKAVTARARHTGEGECEISFVDEAKVAAVRAKFPPADAIQAVADRFHLLSDPTRVRILYALSLRELCVCDLSNLIGRSNGGTSHQLADMRKAGLVKYRMQGKLAYYSLADEEVAGLIVDALARIKDAA
jgi:ArsR family transcriptional regulator